MRQLVIDYVLEGHQRGYNFVSPTNGFNEDDLKQIWRSAMPRGQGWADYVGARSLKCFLPDRSVALCETLVTDQRDEHGRGGIRRTTIEVMSQRDYAAYLEQRLRDLPSWVRHQVARLPSFSQRLAISNKTMPKPRRKAQLVLLAPYDDADEWLVVEGMLIKLALNPVGPMRRWGPLISFTTLALNANEESALVAVPAQKESTLDKRATVLRL